MSYEEGNRPAPGSLGRDATKPGQTHAGRWRDILLSVKDAVGRHRLSLIAGGVGFFAFLAIFPALTALLSVYGLVADPSQVAHHVDSLVGTIPPSALQLIRKQMSSIAQSPGSSLGIALVASVLIAIYSASQGMGAMISALNIALDERKNSGFIKHKALILLYTLAAICFAVIMLSVIGLTAYLQHLGLPSWLDTVIQIVLWIILLAMMIVVVTALYALTPGRPHAPVRRVAPGAILATIIWLIAYIAFSFYITHFGSYNKTYGLLTAIPALMLWLWFSAFVILLGAEVNAALQSAPRTGSE